MAGQTMRGMPALLVAAAGSGLALAPPAHAAGFALIEQSASGMGSAFAGSAASAEDASAQFFNPASLTLLSAPEVSAAAHAIHLRAAFSDRGSMLPPAGLGALPTGATRADAGDWLPVPNLYAASPLGERLAAGIAVNAPFGLKTEYPDGWIGRFQGIKSQLVTVNTNPSLAWRVNERLALGVGADFQHAHAELTNAVMLGPGLEGRARIDARDDAWGWNAGALLTVPGGARLGVGYRSKLAFKLDGTTGVQGPGGVPLPQAGGATQVRLTMPDSAYLSLAQPVGDRLELLADASWTHWSLVREVSAEDPASGVPRDVLRFEFRDTWRGALGVRFRASETWTLRAGVAYDQSPVRAAARTVRLPDADRRWIAVGARWQPAPRIAVDAAYARLFVGTPSIDLVRGQYGAPAAFASLVSGTYDSSVDLVSAQLTYRFR
jgi:long-chain fatty acid transport protein